MTHVGQLQKEQKVVYMLHDDGRLVDIMEWRAACFIQLYRERERDVALTGSSSLSRLGFGQVVHTGTFQYKAYVKSHHENQDMKYTVRRTSFIELLKEGIWCCLLYTSPSPRDS